MLKKAIRTFFNAPNPVQVRVRPRQILRAGHPWPALAGYVSTAR